MKDGLRTDRSGGRSGVHHRRSSHVGGVPNNTAVYDGRHAGVSNTIMSGPYASDNSATVVSGTTGDQFSSEGARPVPTTADVGAT